MIGTRIVLLVIAVCAVAHAFVPAALRTARTQSGLSMIGQVVGNEYDSLTVKFAGKSVGDVTKNLQKSKPNPPQLSTEFVKATPVKQEAAVAPVKKAEAIKAAPVKAEAIKAAPVKVAAPKVAAPVAKVATSAAPVASKIQPVAEPSALSGGDLAAGVGLGLAPYVVLPALLLASLKPSKKVAKAKKEFLGMDAIAKGGLRRVPDQGDAVLPRIKQYSKTLGQGAAEGLGELKQGDTKQAQDIAKGIKIMVGAFGVAGAASALLFATSTIKPSPTPAAGSKTPAVKVANVDPSIAETAAKKEKEAKAAVEKAAAADKKIAGDKAKAEKAVTDKKNKAAAAEKKAADAQAAKEKDLKAKVDKQAADDKARADKKAKTNAPKVEKKAAPKVEKKTTAPTPAPVPVVKAPEVKAPEVKAPEVKVPAPVEARAPVPSPVVKAPAPVEVKAPAPVVKAPEVKAPAPVEARAPVPSPVVKAPAPVEVKAPAPVVKAPEVKAEVKAPAPAPAPVVKAGKVVKAPNAAPLVVPKGMEVEKVDLEALKNLRKPKPMGVSK